MNLGSINDLSPLATLLATTAALIAACVRGTGWLRNWIEDDRIKVSLDRMESRLETARRLDALGEHLWAEETRERAAMAPLRRVSRYEVNRSHARRFVVAYVGWLLYAAAIVLEVAARVNPWLSLAGAASLLVAVGVGTWWLATQPGFEREVTQRAKEKYERHKREVRTEWAGDIAAGDGSALDGGPMAAGQIPLHQLLDALPVE